VTMLTGHNNSEPMSPAQAAQVAGFSRRTIMRAITNNDLLAFRDNKNQWRIKNTDLETWLSAHLAQCPSTGQEKQIAHQLPTNAHHDPIPSNNIELVRVKAELEAERMLRATIEADRDHWRELAQKLIETRTRKWRFW